MKIRAVVADDQPMARERLIALLGEEHDVDVVATAASGTEVVDIVRRLSPDLLFLDMQMPELDGIAVIETIGADKMPATIFVTAYDQYAIRAFDVHAVDYLLKPFGRARFQKALARARGHLEGHRAVALADRLMSLVDELRAPQVSGDRLMIRTGGRVVFVSIDQVDWIEAEGNYVRVHVADDAHLLRETMVSLFARLGDTRFFRIHRSRIVNVSRIKELRLAGGGDYDVILKDGRTLGLSRLYKDALQLRLAAGK